MSNGAGFGIKQITLGGVGAVALAVGAIWTFGDRAVGFIDDRAEDVCQELIEIQVEEFAEEIDNLGEELGNLRGALGEAFMTMCDQRREAGQKVRWWRGECERYNGG